MQQCVQITPKYRGTVCWQSIAGMLRYRHQVARATKFSTVRSSICGSSTKTLRHVILPVPRILRWLTDFFWKKSMNVYPQ